MRMVVCCAIGEWPEEVPMFRSPGDPPHLGTALRPQLSHCGACGELAWFTEGDQIWVGVEEEGDTSVFFCCTTCYHVRGVRPAESDD